MLRKQRMEQEQKEFEEAEAAAKEAADAEVNRLKALTTITTRTPEVQDFLDETESNSESESSISDTGIIPAKDYKVVYNSDPDLMKLGGVVFGHEMPTSRKITAEAAKTKEDEMNAEHAAKKARKDEEAKRRADTLAPAEITNPRPRVTTFDTVETEEALRSSITGTPSDESSRIIIDMDLEGGEFSREFNELEVHEDDAGPDADNVPTASSSKAGGTKKIKLAEKGIRIPDDSENSDIYDDSDPEEIAIEKRKRKKPSKGPTVPDQPSNITNFRNKVIQKRDQSVTQLPETLYCFVNERMDKDKAQNVAEKYIVDKLETAESDNRKTVPIKHACYVLKKLPNETKEEQNKNRTEMKDSDAWDWIDNTHGNYNKPGQCILHRYYYRKLGKTIGYKKNQDVSLQKHVYTLEDPYNLHVIHYLGDNFETKDQYLAKHGPAEAEELPIATEAPVINTGSDHGDGPRDVPSEAETEDGITFRRMHIPTEDDGVHAQYARPRYEHRRKLEPIEANLIMDAYAAGNGKVLNGPEQYIVGPMSGDVYVFDTKGLGDGWSKTILKDTLMWGGDNKQHFNDIQLSRLAQNIKITDPETKKKKTSTKFQRIVYHDGETRRIAIIQYLGDNEVARSEPHGNELCRVDALPFIASSDKVRFDIKKVGLTKKPDGVYRDNHSQLLPGGARNIGNIRNRQQVKVSTNLKMPVHVYLLTINQKVFTFTHPLLKKNNN